MNQNEDCFLREFTDADITSLEELWTATGIGNPARGDSLDVLHKSFAAGGRLYLLESKGALVGSLWLTEDGRRLYLHHMAVLPAFQGRGLSKRLMAAALARARERGLQIKLEVSEDNARAIGLYRKYGFETLEGYRTMVRRSVG